MEEGEMITYFIVTAVVYGILAGLIMWKLENKVTALRGRLAVAESQAKAIARERDDLLGKLSDADAARVASAREWPEILTYE